MNWDYSNLHERVVTPECYYYEANTGGLWATPIPAICAKHDVTPERLANMPYLDFYGLLFGINDLYRRTEDRNLTVREFLELDAMWRYYGPLNATIPEKPFAFKGCNWATEARNWYSHLLSTYQKRLWNKLYLHKSLIDLTTFDELMSTLAVELLPIEKRELELLFRANERKSAEYKPTIG